MMVVIKLAVLVLFIVVGVTGWNSATTSPPFAPFGFSGVMTAAGHHLLLVHRPRRGVHGR